MFKFNHFTGKVALGTVLVGITIMLMGQSRPVKSAELITLLDETKIMASDAQAFDSFGISTAIDGNTIVVGANGEDGGPGNPASEAGAAYVYERNTGGPGNWGEVVRLSAGDGQLEDYFGWVVAISGDWIAVGAAGEDGGPGDPLPDAGAVYLFERNQGGSNNWGQVLKITSNDIQAGDYFGRSVAIEGDTLLVGAVYESGGPGDPLPNAGAVYIFERNQGGANNWGQVKKLSSSDIQDGDYFGRKIDISGDLVVVSATNEDGGPGDPVSNQGAAYVFERNQGGTNNWGQVKKLTASDGQTNDFFGWPAIDGDTIAIGAPGEDGGAGDPTSGAGAAYIFNRNQGGAGNWGELKKITASDAQDLDGFGPGIALSGDTLVVGTDDEDGGPGDPLPQAGAAYIFKRDQGGPDNWGEVEKLTPGDIQMDDRFAQNVAIDGGTIVIGSYLEDGGSGDPIEDSGAAYVFREAFNRKAYLPVMIYK